MARRPDSHRLSAGGFRLHDCCYGGRGRGSVQVSQTAMLGRLIWGPPCWVRVAFVSMIAAMVAVGVVVFK